MNEIISELLKKLDVGQINELLGKLTGKDGILNADVVKKLAAKLGADPQKLLSLLPAILKKTGCDKSGGEAQTLNAEKLLSAIDMNELIKLIPAAGAIKAVHSASKFASKKIEEEMGKIKEVESTLWKGSATTEIQKAAELSAEYAKTEVGETVTEEDVTLLKAYRDLAQKALDNAKDRKERLLKAGTDKYSDPVAEMNTAIVKCSGALRTLNEKVEAAEKKIKR
jgi:hypothetical protein